jgi:glutaredoxin-related protein
MGFWDSVKSVALSVKCFTGWHEGEYEHIKGKPKCFLGKTCPDCNQFITKEEHEYDGWEYVGYSKCDAVRKCIHCKHQQREIRHEYRKEGKESDCRVIEVCIRCRDKKIGRAEHNWVTIPFTDKDLKIQGKRTCRDCKTVE